MIGPGSWLQGSLFVSLKKTLVAFIYGLGNSNLQMVTMIASAIIPTTTVRSNLLQIPNMQGSNGPRGSEKLPST